MTSPMIITAPPPEAPEAEIVSSTFWPAINPVEIREAQRIDNTIPPGRLRAVLIESIATANNALAGWRTTHQVVNNYGTLADVPADKIDNISVLIHRYKRAIGCLAKAILMERLRDYDATGKADKKAETLADTIDDARRDYLAAIADIIGQPRNIIELI